MSGAVERAVFITGAARGIGLATALLFATKGFAIAACDVDQEALEAAAERFKAANARYISIQADVTMAESIQQAVDQTLTEFGRIDVLVNNAGKSLGSSAILDIDEATWDLNTSLNLKSVYLVSRAILPHLIQHKRGVIINITSVNGLAGIGEQAYSASKAGVVNLTKNLAVKYGPFGIRACCIAPGTIHTPNWDERLAKSPGLLDNLKAYYPVGRLGEPEDVANAVYFLASPEAGWISGICLRVDGGLMAGSRSLQRDLMPS